MSENRIAAAYSGEDSYIFISYSHRNTPEVLRIVRRMQDEGYRVWYDEGIDPGTEWDANIAAHVKGCSYFIAFISEAYLGSDNCKDELNYARDLNKERLLIYLEDVELPDGMAMRLNRLQAMHKYKYTDDGLFYAKLFQTPGLRAFCDERPEQSPAQEDAPVTEPISEIAKKPEPPKKADIPKPSFTVKKSYIVIAAVVILALIIGIIVAVNSDSPANAPQDPDSTGVTLAPTEPPVMSDKLSDFTFKLDGKVYKLPFTLSTMLDDGWTISSGNYSSSMGVEADGYADFSVVKDGRSVIVRAYNYSDGDLLLKDCLLCQITFLKDVTVELPCGISGSSGVQEVKDAYGPANETANRDDHTELTYRFSDDSTSMAVFSIYNDGTGEIRLYNKLSEASLAPGEEQDGPVTMSDDLADFTFTLGGKVYKLPSSYSEFSDEGWTISSSGYSESYMMGGNAREFITMVKDGVKLYVRVQNYSGNARVLSECDINGVEIYHSDSATISLAGGIDSASSIADIKAAYGEPDDSNKYSDSETLTYYMSDDYSCYVRFNIRSEGGSISLQNPVEKHVETETDTAMPEYLSTYVAPVAMGSDYTSPIITLEGELYRLAAPLSAFTDNGWEITARPNFVSAGGTEFVTIEKDGKQVDLTVCNFTRIQTLPENCAVIKVSAYADDGVSLQVGGISFDSDGEKIKSVVTDDFSIYESGDSNNYSYFNSETFYEMSFRVDNESGKVTYIAARHTVWDYE